MEVAPTQGLSDSQFTAVDGKLIPEIEEQRVVSRIKVLRAEGYSIRKIVQALAREGIRTRKKTAFSVTQVARILRADCSSDSAPSTSRYNLQ